MEYICLWDEYEIDGPGRSGGYLHYVRADEVGLYRCSSYDIV